MLGLSVDLEAWDLTACGLCLAPQAKPPKVLALALAFLGVVEHSSSCCCFSANERTLLLCISVYAVSVDVFTQNNFPLVGSEFMMFRR